MWRAKRRRRGDERREIHLEGYEERSEGESEEGREGKEGCDGSR